MIKINGSCLCLCISKVSYGCAFCVYLWTWKNTSALVSRWNVMKWDWKCVNFNINGLAFVWSTLLVLLTPHIRALIKITLIYKCCVVPRWWIWLWHFYISREWTGANVKTIPEEEREIEREICVDVFRILWNDPFKIITIIVIHIHTHTHTLQIGYRQLKPKRCLCDFGELPKLIRATNDICYIFEMP